LTVDKDLTVVYRPVVNVTERVLEDSTTVEVVVADV
jgi:hypothetical protein